MEPVVKNSITERVTFSGAGVPAAGPAPAPHDRAAPEASQAAPQDRRVFMRPARATSPAKTH
jgi:hypothetical protein